jgi:hypothetical protein
MSLLDPLKITCRQATYLHTKSREGKLTLSERIGLTFHLTICKLCKRFFEQMDILERSSHKLSDFSEKRFTLSTHEKNKLQMNFNEKLMRDF